MAIFFEFGVVEGFTVFACGMGHARSDLRKVSSLAIPGHAVALLATAQVLLLLALIYFGGKWLRGRKKDASAASPEVSKPGSSTMAQATADSLVPVSTTRAINVQSSSRMFLLPGEIRMVIYRMLLVTTNAERKIWGSADMLDAKLKPALTAPKTASNNDFFHPFDRYYEETRTDATLLRTCHRVYAEALPILYGENTFCFFSGPCIEQFKSMGLNLSLLTNELGQRMPIFGLQPRPQGRLSMVRHLLLVFDDAPSRNVSEKATEQGWSEFLQQNKFTHGIGGVCFESLETLRLDLYEWRATRHRALIVRPFIERFRTSQGLSKLVMNGIGNEDTLLALKRGLLKKGGQFEAWFEWKKLEIAD